MIRSGQPFFRVIAALLLLSLVSSPVLGQDDPVDSDSEYVWDLTSLYASADAWTEAKAELQEQIPALGAFEGRLGESPEVLEQALVLYFDTMKELYRLYTYANLKSDEDTRAAEHLARVQEMDLLSTSFGQVVSYMAPELVAMGGEKIESYLARNEGLEPYDHFLRDVMREAPHVLTPEAERVMAASSLVTSGPGSIYNVFANADMPWPVLDLPGEEEVTLSQSGYVKYRGSSDRDVRKEVFDEFWGTWNDYKSTYGAVLATEVQSAVFQARARKYDSALEKSLAGDNVPTDVYYMLIDQTNENLETLHRYFRLRARMLGVDQMHYYDIYPPLVEADLVFPIEEAKEITFAALEPFGPEYLEILRGGMDARWTHVYPQPGKRSGAYMAGSAYDVHPFLLLNYNEDYNALSTFAHEWGHAVHTELARAAQPFSKYSYSTFTAEVASTINEVLLNNYLIGNAASDQERLFYLGQVLEGLRGTFFRQAMFAEFELAIHEEVEAGRPLTGEKMTEMYGDLLRKYHGHDEGVVTIDDKYAVEWAYIPHFYYDFYVYQYATSIAGGIYFAEQIMEGGEEQREVFLDVLRAGGSDYAYEILKDAGVDMATPAPYQALVQRMNEVMDEIEMILDEQG